MGNTTSIAARRDCLVSAVGPAHVTFQDALLYQTTAVDPYNLNVPVTPAAVTYPQSAEEIAAVVKCAAEYDYNAQDRSGGHSFSNYGMTLALDEKTAPSRSIWSSFSQFYMDESTFVASIGPGITLGNLDTELYNAGSRAMAHGICPTILTVGGLGPTARQWGLALDHIEEVEVVLANSSIVRASDTQNQNIFFSLSKVLLLVSGSSWSSNPGDLSWNFYSNLVVFDGQIILEGIFFGSKEEYDELDLEKKFPTSEPGTVLVRTDWLGMIGHGLEETILKVVGDTPTWFYATSLGFTPDTLIPDSAIDGLVDYIHKTNAGTLAWFVALSLEDGAINAVSEDATAYSHRDVLFWFQVFVVNPLGPISQTTYDFINGLYGVLVQALPESAGHGYLGCPACVLV
ncbi:unnamed protein product [Penicillium nalgiovense]|uniref:FAD-binding PCMH-type domain-containing protein n=1 Tax=Penicillium nalgiovense TaxID=60175 RepID=A0A9W4HWD3_PENNA|nr:unnamed protein product [Penicillium nalgiovense]CAG8059020.1 unnamed protein product [Penicillium nalgiovense]CAG8070601.1 unnamed protein product [Penicillium nalgiovense]CAG8093716.1 unnamed protein product [Penicillium nalgiovense]CAG8097754.1 unnamed protein product [Penicillium nalgiovense]